MSDDFSNAPLSLSEHRALKEDKAKLWTPRDALVNLLRRLDSKELEIENLVIVYETPTEYRSSVATPDEDKTIALLWRGLHIEGKL